MWEDAYGRNKENIDDDDDVFVVAVFHKETQQIETQLRDDTYHIRMYRTFYRYMCWRKWGEKVVLYIPTVCCAVFVCLERDQVTA